jgi:hypothetical protein
MTDKIRDHCDQVTGPGVTFLLGFFLTIFLSSLATTPADAAVVSGYASCPQLQLNSSGGCVMELQRLLDDDGINPQLTVDGIFGNQTLLAVEAFQREVGLTADGIVGPETFGALEQPAAPAGVPIPGTPRSTRFAHDIKNFWSTAWRDTGPPVFAIGVVIIIIFAAAAVSGIRWARIMFNWRRVEVNFERYPPQRIVNRDEAVITRYIDAQSNYPNQFPLPGNHIRSIDWRD